MVSCYTSGWGHFPKTPFGRSTINVITTDGDDVITQRVESLVVTSGERYDFWIHTNDPQETRSYWIRAETLERAQGHKVLFHYHPPQALHAEWFPMKNGRSRPVPIENSAPF